VCDPIIQPYGSAELVDDRGIGDDDRVIRHCRTPVQIVPDELTGGKRISSQAFKPKPGESTSVDLECLLHKAGLDSLHRCGEMPNTYAMIALQAGVLRDKKAGVAHTPKELDDTPANPFHGDIIGLSKKDSRDLVEACSVLVLSDVPFAPPSRPH
jgi:hypothetical protein